MWKGPLEAVYLWKDLGSEWDILRPSRGGGSMSGQWNSTRGHSEDGRTSFEGQSGISRWGACGSGNAGRMASGLLRPLQGYIIKSMGSH